MGGLNNNFLLGKEKNKQKMWEKEKNKKRKIKEKKGFKCFNCGKWVPVLSVGTKHRNHCPFCLWSKHVDLKKSGDRKSKCRRGMKPIGLTFKKEGRNKYGKLRQGELMLIHKCADCEKISLNRIAGDDDPKAILKVFENSEKIEAEKIKDLEKEGINILKKSDKNEILTQLFGKN